MTTDKAPEKFQASVRLAQLISDSYAGAHQAKEEGKTIAWVSTFAPAEILKAMDIVCVFPEGHSATCGGRDVAKVHCELTEARSFSPHLCTYARNDIGSALAGADTQSPVGGLPKPDLLVVANSSCELVTYWWEYLSDYFNVPLFLIDAPFVHDSNPAALEYIQRQLNELIAFLETKLNKKMDYEKFGEIVKRSEKCLQLYRDVLDMTKAVPAPATLFDIFSHNFVALVYRGSEEAIQHYAGLKAEMEERRKNKIGAMANERFRLYWDNIALWFRFGWLGRKLKEPGAALVVSTYSWMFSYEQLDATRPLESIAEYCYYALTNRNPEYKINRINEIVKEYSLDGMIFHFTRSCKAFTLHQLVVRNAITQSTGLPVITLEADMVDSRFFNEQQVNLVLDTLIESMESQKK